MNIPEYSTKIENLLEHTNFDDIYWFIIEDLDDLLSKILIGKTEKRYEIDGGSIVTEFECSFIEQARDLVGKISKLFLFAIEALKNKKTKDKYPELKKKILDCLFGINQEFSLLGVLSKFSYNNEIYMMIDFIDLKKYANCIDFETDFAEIVYKACIINKDPSKGKKFLLDGLVERIFEESHSEELYQDEENPNEERLAGIVDLCDELYLGGGPGSIYEMIIENDSFTNLKREVKEKNKVIQEKIKLQKGSERIERIVYKIEEIDRLSHPPIFNLQIAGTRLKHLMLKSRMRDESDFNTWIERLNTWIDHMDFLSLLPSDADRKDSNTKQKKKSLQLLETFLQKVNGDTSILDEFKKIHNLSANLNRHESEKSLKISKEILNSICQDWNWEKYKIHFEKTFLKCLEKLHKEIKKYNKTRATVSLP
jgi:hypothetical protein